jgi:hypothetical protein
MTQTTQTTQTSQKNPVIKLSAWSKLFWKDVAGWKKAIGYAVRCSCGHGDYHLVMSEPRAVRCVKREGVIVLQYFPSR